MQKNSGRTRPPDGTQNNRVDRALALLPQPGGSLLARDQDKHVLPVDMNATGVVPGVMERWYEKCGWQVVHVWQYLQRTWRALSKYFLERVNAEAGLYVARAVHM